MAQAYVTTFTNDYRWPEIEKTISCKPRDKFAESLPTEDIWLVSKDNLEDEQNISAAEATVRRMIRKRLWSVYQVDYCKDQIPNYNATVEKSFENELLEYCHNLYGPKTAKILPPLPTGRRLFGYMKPKLMYVPTTTYQEDYGKVGFGVLKENYERIEKLPESVRKIKCK